MGCDMAGATANRAARMALCHTDSCILDMGTQSQVLVVAEDGKGQGKGKLDTAFERQG